MSSPLIVTAASLAAGFAALLLVRSATSMSRWLCLVTMLAFAAVANMAARTVAQPVAVRASHLELQGPLDSQRTRLLQAAGKSGARAVELQVTWRPAAWRPAASPAASLSGTESSDPQQRREIPAAPMTALGATAAAPAVLPFAPDALSLRAPARAGVGRPVLLEIALDEAVDPAVQKQLQVEVLVLDASGREQLRRVVRLAGEASDAPSASLEWLAASAGPHLIELSVDVDGHRLVAAGELLVAEPDEVLVCEAGRGGALTEALRTQGVSVREVASWPDDWQRHQRIVLARRLPHAQQRELVRAVADGTGLLVFADAFGAPGDPLHDILPLRPLPQDGGGGGLEGDGPDGEGSGGDSSGAGSSGAGGSGRAEAGREGENSGEPPETTQPETTPPEAEPRDPAPNEPLGGETGRPGPISPEPVEVDKHAIAMVLVVDRSGSMGTPLPGGATKMQYARTSALRTAQALGEADRIGIVTFGAEGRATVELAMTDATAAEAVRAGMDRLAHRNESTFLLDGLRKARELLDAEPAAIKHVIAISDGEFWDKPFALGAAARRMRERDRITLSIVSIVDERTDPGFKRHANDIADAGGGAFVAARDPRTVPVIVSGEVSRTLTRAGREPNQTVADGSGDGPGPGPGPGSGSGGSGSGGTAATDPLRRAPDDPRDEPAKTPPDRPNRVDSDPADRNPEDPSPDDRAASAAGIDRQLTVVPVADSTLLAPEPSSPAGAADEAGVWPTLADARRCEAPLDARVLLVVTEEGWPLLAFANRGLGRVGAFASSPFGAAGGAFGRAPELPAWLAQWCGALAAADAQVEPEQLRDRTRLSPPAPVPAQRAWLEALSGAPLSLSVEAAGGGPPPAGGIAVDNSVDTDLSATSGRAEHWQAAGLAVWLLPLLVLLAGVERATSALALRRGRGD
ncbi:MAG: VWA domain-containing protein [Planctomycetota bacterium]